MHHLLPGRDLTLPPSCRQKFLPSYLHLHSLSIMLISADVGSSDATSGQTKLKLALNDSSGSISLSSNGITLTADKRLEDEKMSTCP